MWICLGKPLLHVNDLWRWVSVVRHRTKKYKKFLLTTQDKTIRRRNYLKDIPKVVQSYWLPYECQTQETIQRISGSFLAFNVRIERKARLVKILYHEITKNLKCLQLEYIRISNMPLYQFSKATHLSYTKTVVTDQTVRLNRPSFAKFLYKQFK